MILITSLLLPILLVSAHGDHSHDIPGPGDETLSYAERHMQTEHHIDNFDLESFFKLHDLNSDGYLDETEIKAVYGLYHHSVLEKVPQVDLQEGRNAMIVDKVLENLDSDKDGKISLDEFVAGGKDGLPTFVGLQGLGHHYDEESEYFLHHEELYHSTPETQTDEAYNHPEDIEHFRHHQKIEEEEDARERLFEGLPPDADLSKDHKAPDPLDIHAHAPGDGPEDGSGNTMTEDEIPLIIQQAGEEVAPPPREKRPVRSDPGKAPSRLKGGSGGHDHSGGRSAEERAKAGVPYKNKFRKGLRADEF